MSESISLLKNKAFKDGFGRAEHIYVRVMDIRFIGKDGLVLFADVTGEIFGTVNKDAFKNKKEDIEVGSVLLLEGVVGLLCVDDHPYMGRKMGSASVHLSVQLENVARVFPYCSEEPSKLTVTSRELEQLKDAYTEDALQLSGHQMVPHGREGVLELRRQISLFLVRSRGPRNTSAYVEGVQEVGKVSKSKPRGKGKARLRGKGSIFHDKSREWCAFNSLRAAKSDADTVEGISKANRASSSLCDDGLDDMFLSLDIEAAIAASKL